MSAVATRPEVGTFVAVLTSGQMVAGTITSVLEPGGFVLDLDPLCREVEGQQHTAGQHAVWEALACDWFARCTRPATRLVRHPVLVAVPACTRCADRAEA